jgi:prevent-host-death family protein
MIVVDSKEAETDLFTLLEKVEAGEVVIITRDGEPIARMVAASKRRPGRMAGDIWISDDFDAPMT